METCHRSPTVTQSLYCHHGQDPAQSRTYRTASCRSVTGKESSRERLTFMAACFTTMLAIRKVRTGRPSIVTSKSGMTAYLTRPRRQMSCWGLRLLTGTEVSHYIGWTIQKVNPCSSNVVAYFAVMTANASDSQTLSEVCPDAGVSEARKAENQPQKEPAKLQNLLT